MTDSFNRVYGKPHDPFYYGLKPSKELEKFLNERHPPTGEALDLGSCSTQHFQGTTHN